MKTMNPMTSYVIKMDNGIVEKCRERRSSLVRALAKKTMICLPLPMDEFLEMVNSCVVLEDQLHGPSSV